MAPKNKINLKDRLEDGELDLSMSDLQEVPVKEIAALKKATSLDLSNNRLKSLPPNFTSLTHIVKLDLSNNQLTELPEDFGALRQLKHLDLYNNQLTHLPLSFSELRSLRWLDVKNNPLVPAVARVAGPCLDAVQCQKSARELVEFFQRTQQQIEDEKQRLEQQRLIELEAQEILERQQEKKREKKRAARARRVGQKVATRSESTSSETVTTVAPAVPQPLTQNGRRSKRSDTKRKSSRRSSFKSYLVSLFLGLIVLFLLSAWPSGPGARIVEVTVSIWDRSTEILPESIQLYAKMFGDNIAVIHEQTSKVLQGPVKYAMYAIADVASIVFEQSRNIITNIVELTCHLVHEIKKKIM